MSDDVEAATHKLLIRDNSEFDIVFPGVGDIGSPGKKYFSFSLLSRLIVNQHVFLINIISILIFVILAIDMALLSLSDHSIISYGTFGMWGALLANNGETIMSKDFIKTDVGERVKEAVDRHNMTNWTFL